MTGRIFFQKVRRVSVKECCRKGHEQQLGMRFQSTVNWIQSMETFIKIIKRKQRELSAEDQQPSIDVCKTDNQLRRELAQTVASWIEERRTQASCKSLPTNLQQSE